MKAVHLSNDPEQKHKTADKMCTAHMQKKVLLLSAIDVRTKMIIGGIKQYLLKLELRNIGHYILQSM